MLNGFNGFAKRLGFNAKDAVKQTGSQKNGRGRGERRWILFPIL
jgi:biotin-(acetyl-CoA carboxylase) ligase